MEGKRNFQINRSGKRLEVKVYLHENLIHWKVFMTKRLNKIASGLTFFILVWTVLYCKEYSYMSFIKASVSCFFSGIFDTWCLASLRDGREAWKPCLEIWYYWHAIYFIFLMLMKTKIFHIIPSLVTWYSWHQKYLISFIVWTPGTHDNTDIQMLSLVTNIQDISIIPVYSIHSTI